MYKLLKDSYKNEIRTDYILYVDESDLDTKYFIPCELGNSDYRKYLIWVAEGNTPEPADSE